MNISLDVLEKRWSNLLVAIEETPFAGFSASPFFTQEAVCKNAIYENARNKLGMESWEPQDVGTGRIQKAVSSALIDKVSHESGSFPNKLIDWRQRADFNDRPPSREMELLLYNLFQSKTTDQLAFEGLMLEKLRYQLLAYLFFLKDKNQFSPIAQKILDAAFPVLGLDFKTSGKLSWSNYRQYCQLLDQVRDFLKTKDRAASLIDAHSFVFRLGYDQDPKRNYIQLTKS